MNKKIKPGDIITTSARNNANFTHAGLVVNEEGKLMVVHNAPGNLNKFGGSIATEDIEAYLLGRELLSIEPTGMSEAAIQERVDALKHKKFSLVNFNCEHFVNFITRGKPVSPQLIQFTRILGIGVLGPLTIFLGIRSRSPLLWLLGTGILLYSGYRYLETDLQTSTGMGDSVKNFIDNVTLGKVKQCAPCKQRQQALNQKMPFRLPIMSIYER